MYYSVMEHVVNKILLKKRIIGFGHIYPYARLRVQVWCPVLKGTSVWSHGLKEMSIHFSVQLIRPA
jgi:hypothetical protein